MTDPGGHDDYATPGALMRRPRVVLAALVAGLGVVTACGDDPSEAVSTPGRGTSAGQGSAGHEAASPVTDGARRVPVTGRSFSFELREITVRVGEDIAIAFTSEDSLHDFTIDGLDAHVAAEPGETAVGGFRAGEPGRYSVYCSVAGHRDAGMEGVVVVEA
jgi:plastocyanin